MKPEVKKTIIITSIVVLLGTGIFFALKEYKKYKDSELLMYEVKDFKMNWDSATKAATDMLSGWTSANLKMNLENFSTSKITVNSLYLEIYAMDGTLIATQTTQLKDKIVIEPNGDTMLDMDLDIQVAGILALVKSMGLSGEKTLANLLSIVQRYYTKGELGVKVQLKGKFTCEGLTFITIPIDTIIDA
jgi:hypothetical protein